MNNYTSKVKYPINTQVYISIGDILLEGIVINTRFALGSDRIQYLIKYSRCFKDGLIHADWYFANDLSNISVSKLDQEIGQATKELISEQSKSESEYNKDNVTKLQDWLRTLRSLK